MGWAQVPAYIAKAELGDAAPLQVARVRRAWRAMRDALAEAARLQAAHADDADLDAPLGKVDLENIMGQFWRRYHFALPAAIEPSDTLKVRVLREINPRLLSVRPVAKAHSARSEAVSRGGSGPPEAAAAAASLVKYLAKLRTFCYAYAIAGAAPLADAPTEPETRASDPLLYVKCPLDTVMRYYYRTEERAYQVAEADPKRALSWLTARDEADRTAWVEPLTGRSHREGLRGARADVDGRQPGRGGGEQEAQGRSCPGGQRGLQRRQRPHGVEAGQRAADLRGVERGQVHGALPAQGAPRLQPPLAQRPGLRDAEPQEPGVQEQARLSLRRALVAPAGWSQPSGLGAAPRLGGHRAVVVPAGRSKPSGLGNSHRLTSCASRAVPARRSKHPAPEGERVQKGRAIRPPLQHRCARRTCARVWATSSRSVCGA